jgi:hypothetical protein
VKLWEIIQDLGTNSVKRFHMEKRIRSNEFGAQGCYFLRRLANNLGEPQRSYALNGIDQALKFWKVKPVRRPGPLRAPWLLSPTWKHDLKQLLTSHVHLMKRHTVSLQAPSTGIVFTKFPSVMNGLCNHKEMATKWADGDTPTCICEQLKTYRSHSLPTEEHLVLDGDTLQFNEPSFDSIATGSLQNKIFPPQREIWKALVNAITTWHKKNSLPSIPLRHLELLWSTSWPLDNHITHRDIVHFKHLFPDAVFHNEDKRATSLRIFCPI